MARVLLLLVLVAGPVDTGAEDLALPPVFLAISVPNLETSLKWYTEKFDLTAVRLPGTQRNEGGTAQWSGIIN